MGEARTKQVRGLGVNQPWTVEQRDRVQARSAQAALNRAAGEAEMGEAAVALERRQACGEHVFADHVPALRRSKAGVAFSKLKGRKKNRTQQAWARERNKAG